MSEGLSQDTQRGWVKRNWWWFVPLLVVLGCAGFFGVGMHLIQKAKESVPYNMALDLVQSDVKVKQKLGEPIEPTWRPPDGEQSVLETGGGNAERRFVVIGPKGEAKVTCRATCDRFVWTLDEVRVKVAGEREAIEIELPPEGDPRRTREEVARENFVDPY